MIHEYIWYKNGLDSMISHAVVEVVVLAIMEEQWVETADYFDETYRHKPTCSTNFTCIIKRFKILSHCYRYELLEHKYYPGMFLKELLWILFHIRKILSSRKKEKTIGSHWL